MTEGAARMASGPRSGRDSGALGDMGLSAHDSHALIEQLPLAVYIDRLDEWSTNVYASPQIETTLGYPADEWSGDNHLLLKILHPDDRDRVLEAHRRSAATGEPFREEYRLLARDGRVMWFLDQATVVPGEPGQPGFHYGFLLDITENKELEEALARSTDELGLQKRYFESLLEISPVAIVTTDLGEVVTSWNPAAEGLFGYSREEAVGRSIFDLVTNTAELRAEASVDRSEVRSGRRVQAITRRTRRDGSLIDVDFLAAPVLLRGEQVGTYAIYHDVSELLRARREADAAAEAKSAFLATMSHEIRTPLNAVIGMTELLLGTELTAEQRELAQVVNTSGDALLGVINEILDFSKIEAGRLELEQHPIVLRECVETALEIVAATAAGKGLELACLIDPGAPAAVLGDPTRLRQILVNLLTNAVKFTERGEVVLTADWQAEAVDQGGQGGKLHFIVRDTGIGIPPDRIAGLFESFSQVDASTTRRYGGTGLGLAIGKRLCEMMGGEMWAESEPGKGSAFHFTVATRPTAGPTFSPAAETLRDKRLLVVDDNAANRDVVTRQARSWGMVARGTASPEKALEWIQRGDPIDIAILDMQMPEMDGVMLAREIRRYRDARALPLVMATSLGRRPEQGEARADFAAILTKPLKASQLYEVVAAAVGAESPVAENVSDAEQDKSPGNRAKLRILLAEDNAVNRQLATRMLGVLGYEADIAVHGLEALQALRRRPYDVVLMDVEMPEMDGLEAARAIHCEWPGEQRPRIVAMTANAMEGDREMYLAAGMDDYVSKPIHLEELAAALSRCTPRAASVARTPEQASPAAEEERVLDPEALERLRSQAGDSAFVAELINTFLRDAPGLLGTIRGSLEVAQAEQLRRAAHTLKSSGQVFGASHLAELCRELEAIAKAGSVAGTAELAAGIEDQYTRVAAALQAAVQEMG